MFILNLIEKFTKLEMNTELLNLDNKKQLYSFVLSEWELTKKGYVISFIQVKTANPSAK